MCILKSWKIESGHTLRTMGKMAGIHHSHVWRAIKGERNISDKVFARVTRIRELERLISLNTPDKGVLEYELELFLKGKI